jgi:cytochrome c biogenesis protein CcmG, thiol:disulfide interchange protein DsbE
MTLRRQWAVTAAVVAVLGLALFALDRLVGRQLMIVSVGSHAPSFRGETVGGSPGEKTLADYRGDVVLLNVWATYCVPCRVEMPSLEVLQKTYGPRGLRIVAMSVDDTAGRAAIRSFADHYGLTFEILHDPTGAIERDYQTTGVPETFVIARDGVIRKKVIGADDWGSPGNQALIAQLLREPAG